MPRRPATGESGGEQPHHTAFNPPPEKPGGARPYLAALASSPKKPGGAWPRFAAVAPPPEEPGGAQPRLATLATTKGGAGKITATPRSRHPNAGRAGRERPQIAAARRGEGERPRFATVATPPVDLGGVRPSHAEDTLPPEEKMKSGCALQQSPRRRRRRGRAVVPRRRCIPAGGAGRDAFAPRNCHHRPQRNRERAASPRRREPTDERAESSAAAPVRRRPADGVSV